MRWASYIKNIVLTYWDEPATLMNIVLHDWDEPPLSKIFHFGLRFTPVCLQLWMTAQLTKKLFTGGTGWSQSNPNSPSLPKRASTYSMKSFLNSPNWKASISSTHPRQRNPICNFATDPRSSLPQDGFTFRLMQGCAHNWKKWRQKSRREVKRSLWGLPVYFTWKNLPGSQGKGWWKNTLPVNRLEKMKSD